MNEPLTLFSLIAEYWQVIFLYSFRYLSNMEKSLNLIHTDNKVQDTNIKNLDRRLTNLELNR